MTQEQVQGLAGEAARLDAASQARPHHGGNTVAHVTMVCSELYRGDLIRIEKLASKYGCTVRIEALVTHLLVTFI